MSANLSDFHEFIRDLKENPNNPGKVTDARIEDMESKEKNQHHRVPAELKLTQYMDENPDFFDNLILASLGLGDLKFLVEPTETGKTFVIDHVLKDYSGKKDRDFHVPLTNNFIDAINKGALAQFAELAHLDFSKLTNRQRAYLLSELMIIKIYRHENNFIYKTSGKPITDEFQDPNSDDGEMDDAFPDDGRGACLSSGGDSEMTDGNVEAIDPDIGKEIISFETIKKKIKRAKKKFNSGKKGKFVHRYLDDCINNCKMGYKDYCFLFDLKYYTVRQYVYDLRRFLDDDDDLRP